MHERMPNQTHANTHVRMHTLTHARAHEHTHAHARDHARTQFCSLCTCRCYRMPKAGSPIQLKRKASALRLKHPAGGVLCVGLYHAVRAQPHTDMAPRSGTIRCDGRRFEHMRARARTCRGVCGLGLTAAIV